MAELNVKAKAKAKAKANANTAQPSRAKLKLDRALVTFDLETTGLDIERDRIVEISCVKTTVNGCRELWTRRINPERPISPEATRVHGIRDQDVASAPTFSQMAGTLRAFLAGCDLSGFNVERFDLPLLSKEFQRVGVRFPEDGTRIIDSWRIFLKKEPRDLSAAYRLYCGKELEGAHSAEADAIAAADVLLAQVEKYSDLPETVDELDAFCHPVEPHWIDPDGKIVWLNGAPVLTFGKHKNQPLQQIAEQYPDYLRWVCTASFSAAVIQICRDALEGRFPTAKTRSAA